jgi:hypothetical protein
MQEVIAPYQLIQRGRCQQSRRNNEKVVVFLTFESSGKDADVTLFCFDMASREEGEVLCRQQGGAMARTSDDISADA